MYELWITDGQYIQGKKLGRSSKHIQTLKARAIKHFAKPIFFVNALNTHSNCIWIELQDASSIGLIQPKGD